MIFFAVQKLLSLIRSHSFIFVFISIILGGGLKKILLQFMSKSVRPIFSAKSFTVSGLTFRSLIHFFFLILLLNLFIYLFIYLWLCWVFVSVRGLSLVVASGSHSSSRCTGLSLSQPLLLWSTGSRREGSVIVAHGPSCSAACGIFPDQGSNPCPLHWQADSQPLCHQGSPLIHFEFIFVYGVRECSNFILLHVPVQFSQHPLLKRLSFLHCIFLPPLS